MRRGLRWSGVFVQGVSGQRGPGRPGRRATWTVQPGAPASSRRACLGPVYHPERPL
nr:hypothetical protein RVX_1588 [Nitratidesulfovibrio sp. HK-II]